MIVRFVVVAVRGLLLLALRLWCCTCVCGWRCWRRRRCRLVLLLLLVLKRPRCSSGTSHPHHVVHHGKPRFPELGKRASDCPTVKNMVFFPGINLIESHRSSSQSWQTLRCTENPLDLPVPAADQGHGYEVFAPPGWLKLMFRKDSPVGEMLSPYQVAIEPCISMEVH